MEKAALLSFITANSSTSFPCHRCKQGRLHFRWDTLAETESAASRQQREYDPQRWSEFEYQGVFSVHLACDHQDCREAVICSGQSFFDISYRRDERDGTPDAEYVLHIKPQLFTPPLAYITLPDTCPEAVRADLIAAFYLTPQSPSSAVNRIRVAIENLLNSFKIPKYEIVKKKRKPLTLNQRIKKGSSKKAVLQELEEVIHAIKWIGNEGSHADRQLTMAHMETVYRLVEHVLQVIYRPEDNLMKIAGRITKNRGITKKSA